MVRRYSLGFGSFFFSFFILLCLVYFFASPASPAHAQSFVFAQNLRFGNSGSDVLELQKLLNGRPNTHVTESGPGSAGSETNYFGPATLSAVIRFQNEFASEILLPQGLSSGTGFVGVATRAKLNSLSLSSASAPVTVPTVPAFPSPSSAAANPVDMTQFNFFSDLDNDTLRLVFTSASFGPPGSTLELSGSGFSLENNTIHFGTHTVQNVKAVSGNKIVFTIPASIPTGVYDLEVSNQKGKTETNSFFALTAPGAQSPKIISVSPGEAALGDEVTISGENFSASGNEVHTTFGIFKNISSADGKTLKVKLQAPAHLSGMEDLFDVDGFRFKVFLYVVNINGMSEKNSPGTVMLK